MTTDDRQRLRELERENRAPGANEILQRLQHFSHRRSSSADRMMVAFIGAGIEPICAALPIAPSTCYLHTGRAVDPWRRSARAQGDDVLRRLISMCMA